MMKITRISVWNIYSIDIISTSSSFAQINRPILSIERGEK